MVIKANKTILWPLIVIALLIVGPISQFGNVAFAANLAGSYGGGLMSFLPAEFTAMLINLSWVVLLWVVIYKIYKEA